MFCILQYSQNKQIYTFWTDVITLLQRAVSATFHITSNLQMISVCVHSLFSCDPSSVINGINLKECVTCVYMIN